MPKNQPQGNPNLSATPEDLADHLFYEIDMAIGCWHLVGKLGERATHGALTRACTNVDYEVLKCAVLEAALLHTRILYEFFGLKSRGGLFDDIKPTKIWSSSTPTFTLCGVSQARMDLGDIDKRLAHLCERRAASSFTHESAKWLNPLRDAIRDACAASAKCGFHRRDWTVLPTRFDEVVAAGNQTGVTGATGGPPPPSQPRP